jgi:phospholipid/cholesterol/gamma-HCH transport system substrate-binding protein
MVNEPQVGRRFRVGIVVLIALVAVMIGVFMVGRRANLFKKKWPYETRFDSASGLVPGNPVRLNGVTVGNVLEVILSPDPADRTVRVVYDVDRRAAPRLRKGTSASIKTIGLLGDKYVDLEGGTAEEPEVAIGGSIPQAPGANIEKLLEGSGDLLTDLGAIARSLKNILGRTEQGKGFLGALTTDSPESAQLNQGLQATLGHLNAVLAKVEKGQGLVGKLLIDEKYGRETGDSLKAAIASVQRVFGTIEQQMRDNTGVIGALLSDPEGKRKVYDFLDNLTRAAASLGQVTDQLASGNGALPILIRDERFGREFTQNLRSFSQHLDSVARKLDDGTGTAGKLINDPAIFDAARHLVVGVDESKTLRWLIRNRQKAGIRKEYNDTVSQTTSSVEAGPVDPSSTPDGPTPTPTPARP